MKYCWRVGKCWFCCAFLEKCELLKVPRVRFPHSPYNLIKGDFMASKKRKKKTANEGGHNYFETNPHLQRKKTKIQLSQKAKSERRPQKKG